MLFIVSTLKMPILFVNWFGLFGEWIVLIGGGGDCHYVQHLFA
jgi:hypothetical protein